MGFFVSCYKTGLDPDALQTLHVSDTLNLFKHLVWCELQMSETNKKKKSDCERLNVTAGLWKKKKK